MHVVEKLLNTAGTDREFLKQNVTRGDISEKPRDVDFVLYAKDAKRANLVASFIHDNSYGRAIVQEIPENPPGMQHRIIVIVLMPTTENVYCAVSGLMVFLSSMYDLDYNGGGYTIQPA